MNEARLSIRNQWLGLIRSINTSSTSEIMSSVADFLHSTAAQRGAPPPSMSADEAVQHIQSGDVVFVGSGLCKPPDLSMAFAARVRTLERVQLQCIGLAADSPIQDPVLHRHLRITTFFVDNPALRELISTGRADYVPMRLSELFASSCQHKPADVCIIRTSPPDANGMISLSTHTGLNMGKLLSARRVFAEVDPGIVPMPGFTRIPVSAVDGLIESSQRFQPVRASTSAGQPAPVYESIASHAVTQIEDGATIQIGVGRFLPYLLAALSHKKHLGLHASFMTHDVLTLIQKGVIDNSQKGCFDGISIVGTSALTQDLIDFNQTYGSIHFYPVEFFANPSLLGHHRKFFSITGALEVDLTGQVGSDSIGNQIYSGLGAQQDFIWGAQLSPEGKTIILLPSTVKDGSTSKICTKKQHGSGQTSSRGDVDTIVTEHGVASLKGLSIAERALALIDIADPAHRQALHDEFFFVGHSSKYHT